MCCWCVYACQRNHQINDFQEILALISVIILTFESSRGIVLVGDMNASVLGRQDFERDQTLIEFIEKHRMSHQQSGLTTYVHAGNYRLYFLLGEMSRIMAV